MVNNYLENLLDTAKSETDSRRRRVSRAVGSTVAAYFSAYTIIVGAADYFHEWRLMVFASGLSAIPASIALGSKLSVRFMQVTRELAACDDTRAIPALSEAVLHGRGALQDTAAKALVRLLLKVTEADSSIFTPEVTIAQRRLVHRSRDLKLALLNAYAHVGRASELKLANRIIHQAWGKDKEVVAAAERCAMAIRMRIEQANVVEALLRVPTTGNDLDLLRTTEKQEDDNTHALTSDSHLPDITLTAGIADEDVNTEQERLRY